MQSLLLPRLPSLVQEKFEVDNELRQMDERLIEAVELRDYYNEQLGNGAHILCRDFSERNIYVYNVKMSRENVLMIQRKKDALVRRQFMLQKQIQYINDWIDRNTEEII
jgi:hypothetical protein